jgi:hypothetical protein
VPSAATVTIVRAARAAVLSMIRMISVRRLPATERHAPDTIGCGRGSTIVVFPVESAFRHHSGFSARRQLDHGRRTHPEPMTVVTQLFSAVGTLTAVVLLLLMAAVPLLLDLPLHRRSR